MGLGARGAARLHRRMWALGLLGAAALAFCAFGLPPASAETQRRPVAARPAGADAAARPPAAQRSAPADAPTARGGDSNKPWTVQPGPGTFSVTDGTHSVPMPDERSARRAARVLNHNAEKDDDGSGGGRKSGGKSGGRNESSGGSSGSGGSGYRDTGQGPCGPGTGVLC